METWPTAHIAQPADRTPASAAVHQGRVDAFTYEQTRPVRAGRSATSRHGARRCSSRFTGPTRRSGLSVLPGCYRTVQVPIRRRDTYKADPARVSHLDLKTQL